MMLGNQSIKQIEERIGVIIPKELKEIMETSRQHKADDVAEGKWHCFDIPFTLICGGKELFDAVAKHLQPLSKEIKEPLRVIQV